MRLPRSIDEHAQSQGVATGDPDFLALEQWGAGRGRDIFRAVIGPSIKTSPQTSIDDFSQYFCRPWKPERLRV